MKVLQVHNRYRKPGGEDGVVEAEAGVLRSYGHDVRLFSLQNRDGPAAAVDLAMSAWNPNSAGGMRKAVDEYRPDVIHVHNTWFRMTPSVLRVPIATVMTLHNYRLICPSAEMFRDERPCRLCLDGSTINSVIHGCYHNPMTSIPAAVSLAVHRKRGTYEQEVDLFAALTDFTRTLMIESGIPEDRIVVKPNFVEDPGAPSVRSDTSETLLYVGRLESSKGVGQLARIWRDRKAPFPLTVVGDGPLRPELDRLPGVTTTGWLPRDRVGDLIAQARAVLVPSLWYEGQPLVVLESFARGTPVVASAHGGLGETVRPANPELLVEPGDVDSLLDAFEKLKDSAFVGEAGRRSRQVYESKHTPEVAVRKLESIYQAAIAVRRRR